MSKKSIAIVSHGSLSGESAEIAKVLLERHDIEVVIIENSNLQKEKNKRGNTHTNIINKQNEKDCKRNQLLH
jgi:ribosomal protein L24